MTMALSPDSTMLIQMILRWRWRSVRARRTAIRTKRATAPTLTLAQTMAPLAIPSGPSSASSSVDVILMAELAGQLSRIMRHGMPLALQPQALRRSAATELCAPDDRCHTRHDARRASARDLRHTRDPHSARALDTEADWYMVCQCLWPLHRAAINGWTRMNDAATTAGGDGRGTGRAIHPGSGRRKARAVPEGPRAAGRTRSPPSRRCWATGRASARC